MRFQLPPGFRFHPTDEELVKYYLTRKVCNKKIGFDAIGVIDLYKYEPWELPEKSFLQTGDLEWYFFNPKDRKYANSSRANRATEKGHWKATGKDRFITSGSRHVGIKKTLVYYFGRAPKAERTNWVMHEYRLSDEECERLPAFQYDFVLCRIHQKSGPGPKNGEQYGAPIEDDNLDDFNQAGLSDPVHYEDGSLMEVNGNNPVGKGTISRTDSIMPSWIEENAILKSQEYSPAISPGNVLHVDLCVSGTENIVQVDSCISSKRDLMVPDIFDSDNCILQELYELVATSSSKDADTTINANLLPPTDGDFLELNDLFPTYNADDGSKTYEDCSRLISCNLPQQHTSNSCHVIQQSEIKQNVQKTGPSDVMDQNFHRSSNGISPLESSFPNTVKYGMVTRAPAVAELEYDNILELFEPLNALFHEENESLNVGFSESTQNGLVDFKDAEYFDAVQFFQNVNMDYRFENGEMNNTTLYQDQRCIVNDQNAGEESQQKDNMSSCTSEQQEDQIHTLSDENVNQESQQKVSILAGASQHRQKGIGIVLKCLESFPAFPASAADLSPKMALPSLKATIDEASVVCTCMEKTIDSVCAKCSKKGKFIRSLSINATHTNINNASGIGFFIVVLLFAMWVMFWILIAGGLWKLMEQL